MPRESGSPVGPVTSTTLLEGLRDPANRTIWRQYVDRYRPLIVRYVTKLGAPDDEAEDIAQATLLAFSTAYRAGRYDRDRGRLSSWLFGFATKEVRSWERGRAARRDAPGSQATEPVSDDELEGLWEREWRDAILAECLRLVRREVEASTVSAFLAFALEGRPVHEVAQDTGLSENAVYGAKRRVLERIRELAPVVDATW